MSLFTASVAAWMAASLLMTPMPLAGRQPVGSSPPFVGSWQLVQFEGGDGTVLKPDDPAKYTVELDAKGGVSARLDCNRGRGTWTSHAQSQLQFGPMALTRAACPPGSLHDQMATQWGNIRSYTIKGGHLFLALMADGGIYEFAPATPAPPAFKSPVPSKGPVTFTCTPGDEALQVTFYETTPAMVLLERGGVTRPAFQVKSGSGARFEGDGIQFWEARAEAMLTWQGAKATCKRK